jgi:hypothetical protein
VDAMKSIEQIKELYLKVVCVWLIHVVVYI